MSMEDHIKELYERREKAKQMGGAERIAKQHKRGRLSARERVEKLLDPGSEKWKAASSPWGAAGVYGLHDIIDPRDTRKFIFQTLEMLRGNRDKVIGEHRLQDWPTGF
jgi:acetyl-CoA carboxylase carboxyltransferase component